MKVDIPKGGGLGRLEIVVTSDELTVTKPASVSSKTYFFGVSVFFYLWFLCINLVGQAAVALRPGRHPAMERTDLLTILSVFAFPLLGCAVFLGTVFQWVRAMVAGREVLRCTPDFLEITTLSLGRVRRRSHFAVSEVRECEFEREGATHKGLGVFRFMVAGKTVTCFRGVKAAEARAILKEMSRFGVDLAGDSQRR